MNASKSTQHHKIIFSSKNIVSILYYNFKGFTAFILPICMNIIAVLRIIYC